MLYPREKRTNIGVAVNEKLDDMSKYNVTGAITNLYLTVYFSGPSCSKPDYANPRLVQILIAIYLSWEKSSFNGK